MNNIKNNEIQQIPSLSFLENKEYHDQKRVNSQRKGKNFERFISKDLEKRFSEPFRRVPCSGGLVGGNLNFYKNFSLNESVKRNFSGDIICPEWFPFVIEVKCYKDTPKLHLLLKKEGDATFNKWIEQAKKESAIAQKWWLIIFKITDIRGEIFCAISSDYVHLHLKNVNHYNYIKYNDVYIFSYEEFWDMFTVIIKKKHNINK